MIALPGFQARAGLVATRRNYRDRYSRFALRTIDAILSRFFVAWGRQYRAPRLVSPGDARGRPKIDTGPDRKAESRTEVQDQDRGSQARWNRSVVAAAAAHAQRRLQAEAR